MMTRAALRCRLLLAGLPVLMPGCRAQTERAAAAELPPGSVAAAVEGVATGVSVSGARFVATIGGFAGPESVRYDPEQDVFFVSNMTGYGSAKDGNGYISRVSAADPSESAVLAQGGRNGVTLHAPKGMAIHGDTLWVADIDALRGFDRRTGAPLATVDFAPQRPVLLNDVAVGPDGTLRVTDTGISMAPVGVVYLGPSRVFAVGAGGAVTVADSAGALWPNGIAWDRTGGRWVVVSFDPFVGQIIALDGSATAKAGIQVLHKTKGRLDGVEVLAGGDILYTCWTDSSLHLLRGAHDRVLVRQLPEPADIGIDTKRGRVAVPLSVLGQVQIWTLERGK